MFEKDGKIITKINEKYMPALECYDDRTDLKWHHPELTAILSVPMEMMYDLNDPEISREERIKRNAAWEESMIAALPAPDTESVTRECFTIKGLYEDDPDIKIYVVKPKGSKKKKLPVFFAFGQGSMISNRYENLAGLMDPHSIRHNCAVVFVEARSAIHTYFPKPLDDYQAGYQWLLEQGEGLGLDVENIVLYGESGGGYAVLSFAFRCKRLGFTPKGCMACEPIVENLMGYPSSRIITGGWDSPDVNRAFKMCIREGDQFSPFVGPETVPNRATVEDCKGLCPIYLHALEMDSDRDPSMDFVSKLYQAKVFTQFHVWGGSAHGGLLMAMPGDSKLKDAYEVVRDAEIHDMFTYDLRRPWSAE